MLKFKVVTRPYWVESQSVKQRLSIFRRYSKDAILAVGGIFKKEFHKRTNKSSGTHIKSRRVSNMELRYEVDDANDAISFNATLDSNNPLTVKIAHALEEGATIRSKQGKLLTIPKHLIPGRAGKARTFTSARWIEVGDKKVLARKPSGLSKGFQSKSTHRPLVAKPRRKVKKSKPVRQEWEVLYWGKESVKIKPKHYFRDTARETLAQFKKRYPRSVRVAWNKTWGI